MKKRKIVIKIIEFLFFIILLLSSYKLLNYTKDTKENKNILDNLSKSVKINKKDNKLVVNFDELKKINSDTIAYIKINNTNIDYPVVKTNDNDFYLNHNFEKKSNSGGWIFADYKNNFDGNDRNIVIYGHNMKNKSMFGTLSKTLTSEFQNNENNLIITLVTNEKEYKYKIFSTYRIENEEYYIKTNFASDNEYIEFLSTIKKRSNKYFDVSLDEKDQILTLSTCANNNNRIVVHAKKEKENE